MTKYLVPILLLSCAFCYSQVGIGTITPSSAAMLEINGGDIGNFRGVLPPRVPDTAAQLSINPSIADVGLIVFVEDTGCLDFWSGTAWENIYCTGGPVQVWVNEFHYQDNAGDNSQFIEIAGVAGTDISGYYVVRYNGNTGNPYGRLLSFSGIIDDEENGYGAIAIAANNLQNALDGFALVGPDGKVIQFLSYEGTFVATGGPANGLTSLDVGFAEGNTTTATQSIHLTGAGNSYTDFVWSNSTVGQSTEGSKNTGQTFN